jgi:hypothetical protein
MAGNPELIGNEVIVFLRVPSAQDTIAPNNRTLVWANRAKDGIPDVAL